MKLSKYFNSEEIAIYNYMVEKYDQLTKNGENYVPEIHDEAVSLMASEKFGKTLFEVDNIYIKISFYIGDNAAKGDDE